MIYRNQFRCIGILFFSCFIFIAQQSFAQQVKKDYWDNGKVKSEGAYNNASMKVGKWKYYYQNGQLEVIGDYTGNKIDKTIEVFKSSKTSALDDGNNASARNGEWVFYYSDGKVKGKASYQDGCPVGKAVRWHKNGGKAEESDYIDCKAIGGRMMWDDEGRKYFETRMEGNGSTVEIEWYPDGQMKSMIPFKNGQQYGRVKRWYKTGQREEDVMMKNTRVHGQYRSWYANGKKQREFFSINNIMTGEYREWNEAGILVREIIESTEQKIIVVRNFWDNGTKKMEGTSKMPPSLSIHQWAQSRNGAWTYWDKDGNVLKTENYEDGRLVSVEMP
jgi:antitoxin component YwqK of YwqJK toxin-antitoxin module